MAKITINTSMLLKLARIADKDYRRTFADFYFTFDLSDYYTPSMVHLLMAEKRKPINRDFLPFLERCLSIYDNNTTDYSIIADTQLRAEEKKFETANKVRITPELLGNVVSYNITLVKKAINGQGRMRNDVYDAVSKNLVTVNRDENSYTSTVDAYNELVRRIMRAQIYDGTKIITNAEIAQNSGISIDILETPEIACHNALTYHDTYKRLVESTPAYAISRK